MSKLDQFAGSELSVVELDEVSGGAVRVVRSTISVSGATNNTAVYAVTNNQLGLVNFASSSVSFSQGGHALIFS